MQVNHQMSAFFEEDNAFSHKPNINSQRPYCFSVSLIQINLVINIPKLDDW